MASNNGKLVLNPDLLTPRDMMRARVMLEGKNPYEMLDDADNVIVLTIWCLRTRTNPDFTWEDALDTPFSEFEVPEETPPEIAPALNSGSMKRRGAKTVSKPKQNAVEGKSLSVVSSDSPNENTTE